jgi:hypothetical protein
MKYLKLLLLVVLTSGSAQLWSQKSPGDALTIKLNESGDEYLKFSFLGQVWLRETQTNPGSTVYGTPVNHVEDIGLRRWRMIFQGRISDRVSFFTQFGQNNFGYLSQKYAGSFFHDAVIDFAVVPKHLTFGGGLTGFGGPSRYSSPSVGSFLGLDAPLYQQTTNGVSDQFLRKLAVYAKGKIGKLDYRVALSKPMAIQLGSEAAVAISETSSFSKEAPNLQPQGYVSWQFLDQESNANPYATGTYLGKKSVFNIGAGAVYQSNAMWHTSGTDTVSTDMLQLAVDAFLDLPINKSTGSAITAYAAFHSLDFGKDYLRDVGAMNPTNGLNGNGTISGSGDAFPMIGTGTVGFVQVGYKFKDNLIQTGTIQPYGSVQYANYTRLDEPMVMWETGVNYLLYGSHMAKISACYQNRPVFDVTPTGVNEITRRGMAIVQLQVAI